MTTTKNGIYYPDDYNSIADVPEDMKKQAESVDEAINNLKQNEQEHNGAVEERLTQVEGRTQSLDYIATQQNSKISSLIYEINELTGKAGNKLKLEIDKSNYIMTLELLNEQGATLDTKRIDFPLESFIVDGKYENGNIILTLQSGTEITIAIGDIINGLISQETFDETVEKINTEINNIKSTIETMQEKQEKLEAENQRLKEDIDGIVPTIEGEGENITLNGTSESRFKSFEVSGNSWQETRSGKNILNPDIIKETGTQYGLSWMYNKETSELTLNGTATDFNVWFAGQYQTSSTLFILKKGKTYTFPKQILLFKTNDIIYVKSPYTPINEDYEVCGIRLNNENVGHEFNDEILRIFVNEGNNEDTEYEKYGAMPSPEYPSEIRNCGDNVNLLIGTDDLSGSINQTYVTEEEYEGCKVAHASSNNLPESSNYIDALEWEFSNTKPNTYYTLSFWAKGTGRIVSFFYPNTVSSGYDSQGLSTNALDGNIGITLKNEWQRFWIVWKTLPTIEGVKRIIPARINRDIETEIWIAGVKLEEGTKATPYSKYGEGNMNFSVGNNNWFNKNSISIISTINTNYTFNDGVLIAKPIDTTKTSQISLSFNKLSSGNYTFNSLNILSTSTQIRDSKNNTIINLGNDVFYRNFEVKEEATIITLNYKDNIEEFTTDFNAVQIAKGTYIKENFPSYVPHQSQPISFPTKPGQVLHKGDYLAENDIKQMSKKVELTGEETIAKVWVAEDCNCCYMLGTHFSDSKRYDRSETIDVICKSTHYISTYTDSYQESILNNCKDDVGKPYLISIDCFKTNGNVGNIILKHKGITSVEELRAFFKAQKEKGTPVTLEYELEEPIIVPYSEEQQKVYDQIKQTLHSYKDVTHIFSEDEISPRFKVEARADLQTEHDKIHAELNEIKELLSTTETSAMLVENLEKDLEREVM